MLRSSVTVIAASLLLTSVPDMTPANAQKPQAFMSESRSWEMSESTSGPLTILKVTGGTAANASAGVPGLSGDYEHNEDGREVVAQAKAPDAPDRKPMEGMKDPEARAWGVWNYESAKGTVGLYARNLVDPGTRWLSDSHLKEIPGSKRIWATPKASLDNQVEVTLANKLGETKVLVATAQIVRNTSISLLGKGGPTDSYFKPLTMISQDGTEHEVPAVWHRGETAKSFELGQIKAGEVVKVRIGRKLESFGKRDEDAGAIQEDISITFSLN